MINLFFKNKTNKQQRQSFKHSNTPTLPPSLAFSRCSTAPPRSDTANLRWIHYYWLLSAAVPSDAVPRARSLSPGPVNGATSPPTHQITNLVAARRGGSREPRADSDTRPSLSSGPACRLARRPRRAAPRRTRIRVSQRHHLS
jgi:hypothetical protein